MACSVSYAPACSLPAGITFELRTLTDDALHATASFQQFAVKRVPSSLSSSSRALLFPATSAHCHSPGASSPRHPRSHKRGASVAPRAASSLLSLVPEHKVEQLDILFPILDPKSVEPFDLVVAGAGPAGLSVAYQVAAAGLSVCVVDPAPESVWPNNYGVWVDEFEALGLGDCLDYVWPRAVVFLDDDKQKFLDRPYGRVNRRRLKTKMGERCLASGVKFHKAKVDGVVHDELSSVVRCADGVCITASLVLDATGFSRRLIQYSQPCHPGYQAAWGCIAQVESHPFDLKCMVFMDWRDSHFNDTPLLKQRNKDLPTFLYAMPLSPTRIFLEETSLVARPAVGFEDIQERMEKRLAHLGIRVKSIEEEEYCLIPMGGVLPLIPQRVLGIGGTVGMVHPSTGYMVARTLGAAPVIAKSIIQQLGAAKAEKLKRDGEGEGEGSLEGVASRVWADIWPTDRKEQREFFCFGMDVLLRLDLDGNRRFFDAFFDLSPYHWQGFLSSRLTFSELISFGLSLFVHATTPARLEIMAKGLPGLLVLIQNMVALRLPHPQPQVPPLPQRPQFVQSHK